MADSAVWVAVREGIDPYVVPAGGVEAHIQAHGEYVYLVPRQRWKEFEEARKRLQSLRMELATFRRAAMVLGTKP